MHKGVKLAWPRVAPCGPSRVKRNEKGEAETRGSSWEQLPLNCYSHLNEIYMKYTFVYSHDL